MTRRVNQNFEPGFTLIELLLSLAFVAFIMIFAITTVVEVFRTYNKGLAVKEINQAGRTTIEDVSRYLHTADSTVVLNAVSNSGAISAGRACFGGISYVWNLYNTPSANLNKYSDGSSLTLSRVSDAAGAMCNSTGGSYPAVPKASGTDVLSSNVWVTSISFSANGSGSLIDISLQLAVANDPVLTNGQCAEGGGQGQFCATSNFSTTVLTGGGN